MGKQRFEALDAMRGIAALAVVISHSALGTASLLPAGWLSVDLFFSLSGFVIAWSYEDRLRGGLGLAAFLRARGRRLLPTHFVAIGIVIFVTVMTQTGGAPQLFVVGTWEAALLNTFLIPIIGQHTDPFPINPALWSLWAEWIVSILYGALMYGMRSRVVVLASVLSFCVFAVLAFHDQLGWGVGSMHGNPLPAVFRALGGFGAGVLVYRSHKRGWIKSLPSLPPWCIYAGWILICATPKVGSTFAVECIVAVVIVPLTVAQLVRAERPVWPIFRWLGALSYPLYVSHLAVLIFLGVIIKYLDFGPSALYAIPVVALALPLAQTVRRVSEIRLAPVLARFRTAKGAA